MEEQEPKPLRLQRCNICNDFLNSSQDMERYKETRENIKLAPCLQCQKSYVKRSKTLSHTKWMHKKKDCSTTTSKQSKHQRRQPKHSERDISRTTADNLIQEQKGNSQIPIQTHAQTHADAETDEATSAITTRLEEQGEAMTVGFICAICHKAFSRLTALKDHTKTHYKLYRCINCKERFAHQSFLSSHVKWNYNKQEGEGELKLTCPYVTNTDGKKIGLEVDEKRNRRMPNREKAREKRKKSHCEICDKPFATRYNKARHENTPGHKQREIAMTRKTKDRGQIEDENKGTMEVTWSDVEWRDVTITANPTATFRPPETQSHTGGFLLIDLTEEPESQEGRITNRGPMTHGSPRSEDATIAEVSETTETRPQAMIQTHTEETPPVDMKKGPESQEDGEINKEQMAYEFLMNSGWGDGKWTLEDAYAIIEESQEEVFRAITKIEPQNNEQNGIP